MAEVIWTDPALDQLEEIAEYIALDKPGAASGLVKKIFSTVERLEMFPELRISVIPNSDSGVIRSPVSRSFS